LSAVVKTVFARPSHVLVIRPTSVPAGSWIEKFQARQFSARIAPIFCPDASSKPKWIL